jgi:hypothetical protein
MEVIDDVNAKICPYCNRDYSSHSALIKHLKKTKCGTTNNPNPEIIDKPKDDPELEVLKGMTMADIYKLVSQMSKTINLIKDQVAIQGDKLDIQTEALNVVKDDLEVIKYDSQPNLTNNLNVLCLTGKEDYCKELLSHGDSKKTLIYIKNCALGRINGDCRLLIKMCGLDTNQPTIVYENKGKTKIAYYDGQRRRTVESNLDEIAKKLASNLITTYFSMSDHIKNDDGTFKKIQSNDPNLPVIEQHEIALINQHAFELREKIYRKDLLKSLPIRFIGDIQN